MIRSKHDIPHGEAISIAIASCGHNLGCGCDGVSECCFKCPLEYCRFEVIGGLKAIQNIDRNREIIQLYRQGQNTTILSRQFNLNKTTIRRIVKHNGRLD